MKSNLKYTFIAGSSFAGGILAGWLLSGKSRNPAFLSATEKFDNFVKQTYHKSEEGVHKISEKLKKSFSSPIPDLYSATESFYLDEEDLMDV